VPIRDLRMLLERVVDLDYAGRDDEPGTILDDPLDGRFGGVRGERPRGEELVRFLRGGLRRQITEKRARAHTTVVVYLLDEAIEQLVRSSDGRPLAEVDAERIHDAVRTELAFLPPNVTPPAILAWDDVCAQLRETLRPVFPRMFVLGYQDLEPEVNVQPIARLSLT
jgi:type III secretory pathway component EscV